MTDELDPSEFQGRLQAVTDQLQSASNMVAGAINLSSEGIIWDDMDVVRIGELITELRDNLTTLKKTTGA